MDYLCAKFGDFSFCFIMRTDRITESHTEADDRHTHATRVVIGGQCPGDVINPVEIVCSLDHTQSAR